MIEAFEGKGIALYGGSFDPPHHGHVHVALTALEQGVKRGEIDRVWVVPTFRNPLRGRAPIADCEHRLEMVKRAFAPFARIKVCDIELRELFACYTIDVVRRLRQTTPQPFRLVLGSDCLSTLPQWKECEELLKLASPYLIARSDAERKHFEQIDTLDLPESAIQALKEGWIEAPCLDISSTRIRARLKEGLYCDHLVPSSVLAYIKQQCLY